MTISLPMYKKIQETYLQSVTKLISRAARNYIPFNLNAVNYAKSVFYYICIVQIFLLSIFPPKLISFHWINQYFSQQEKKDLKMNTVQKIQYKCIELPKDNDMSRDCGHLKALKHNFENCFT